MSQEKENLNVEIDIDKKALRTGLLKSDVMVTGVCMVLYLLGFLDKANLGNAKVAGLERDLNLSSFQYSLVLTLFYIPYIIAELPANLLLKKIGAHILLPTLTFTFGLICCLQGFVTNYAGLVACRLALGLSEGGLIPTICLYLSTFYRPDQYQLRASFCFSFAALAGAFSGLLAAGIQNMDGIGNKPGWAWIFFLEGGATCIIAIIAFFLMSPTIEKAWWLKPDEKSALLSSFEKSGRSAEINAKFTWAEVRSAFTSPVVLMNFPIFIANGLIVFGLAYFQPTIVGSLGYSQTQTQLRSVPPYAVVFVMALVGSYFADRFRQRAIYISIMGLLSSIGYIMNLTTESNNVRYAALFLVSFGGYGASPSTTAWIVDNIGGHYKRGTAIAISFIGIQIGGIISTWIYPSHEAPKYHTGASVSLTATVLLLVAPIALAFYLMNENKKKERILESVDIESISDPTKPMDDTDPRFKYCY